MAHKETINLAMQNGINLAASLLCDNDIIKRAVSARVKFTESGVRQFIEFYKFKNSSIRKNLGSIHKGIS